MNSKKSGPSDEAIGLLVRSRRLSKNMTQEELGNALGISFQQIQKYEKGTNRISASRLSDIAALFDVPVEVFYAQGGSAARGSKNILSFEPYSLLSTKLALRLLRAFVQVSDLGLQQSLVHHIEHLAALEKKKGKVGRKI